MDQGPFGWHRESWKQSLCSLFRLSNIEQDSSLIRTAIAGSSVLVNMLDTQHGNGRRCVENGKRQFPEISFLLRSPYGCYRCLYIETGIGKKGTRLHSRKSEFRRRLIVLSLFFFGFSSTEMPVFFQWQMPHQYRRETKQNCLSEVRFRSALGFVQFTYLVVDWTNSRVNQGRRRKEKKWKRIFNVFCFFLTERERILFQHIARQ